MKVRLDRRVGLLLGGILLATFVALGGSVALPATDPDVTGDADDRSRLETRGLEVYRNEGCWYCHTRYVRNSRGDLELGAPLDSGAYAGESPSMLGLERIGPDLTHPSLSESALVSLFGSGEDAHSPSYEFLSEADVRALTAYLLSLQ